MTRNVNTLACALRWSCERDPEGRDGVSVAHGALARHVEASVPERGDRASTTGRGKGRQDDASARAASSRAAGSRKRCRRSPDQSQYLQGFPDAIPVSTTGARTTAHSWSVQDYRSLTSAPTAIRPGARSNRRAARWNRHVPLLPRARGLIGEADVAEDHGLLYAAPNGKYASCARLRGTSDATSGPDAPALQGHQRHLLGVGGSRASFRFETVAETRHARPGR